MQARILVIDPLPDLIESLAAFLDCRGWSVETARSLVEALTKIDHFEPHVVLAGVESPMEVGIAFADRVRALHDGSVVLVAMSAWSPTTVKAHSPHLFDRVCHKPLTEQGISEIERAARERFPNVTFHGEGR